MSMLNQAAVEELYSGTYLANYLKTMEYLPDELQRQISMVKELEFQCRELLSEIESQQQVCNSDMSDTTSKRKAVKTIQRSLIRTQEIGDEKLAITALIIELIENRTRQLDQDLENLDPTTNKEPEKVEEVVYPKKVEAEKTEKNVQKRQRRIKQETKDDDAKEEPPEKVVKRRKRRAKKEKESEIYSIDPIDPDEPLYCLCDQVSYGEMIGCDNEQCSVEWFHFNCVGLYTKPKGKWFCPNCRGDRPSVIRPELK